MTKYLQITIKELQALIETAETCYAIGGDEFLAKEASASVKAYKSVLKRNNLKLNASK